MPWSPVISVCSCACVVAAVGGCGRSASDRAAPSRPVRSTAAAPTPGSTVGGATCEVLATSRVSRALGVGRLRAEAVESTDRSTCRYANARASVRVQIDREDDARRRFLDLESEASQISGMYRRQARPRLVEGVGEDQPSNPGAYWSAGPDLLTAIKGTLIARTTIDLPGHSDSVRSKIAATLTHAALAQLPGTLDR